MIPVSPLVHGLLWLVMALVILVIYFACFTPLSVWMFKLQVKARLYGTALAVVRFFIKVRGVK